MLDTVTRFLVLWSRRWLLFSSICVVLLLCLILPLPLTVLCSVSSFVSCFLSSLPTLSFATFSVLSVWSVPSPYLVSLLGIFLSFSLFCGVLPLSHFPLARCVTLPTRSSSCCLLLLLVVWGNFRLCPHRFPLLVRTCFCPIFRSFGRD